ncbi:AMP-dependent synthetase/ligase [Nocardia alni]|uniref:AMP-dependent synthetase/ligase n=1 Tax=Nocardia alni TaxID=2815723 RepID=UPI001C230DF0|nr:AMP-dependent synthetase/ligase [Nocardia alni]
MTATTAAPDSAIRAETLPEAFQRTLAERPDAIAFRAEGDLPDMTWAQYDRHVREAASVLTRLGLTRADTVALLFNSRREFHWIDTAALHLGVTSFSLYNTASLDAMVFALENSGAKVVFVEAAYAERATELARHVERVVVVCADQDYGLPRWEEFTADSDDAFDLRAAAARIEPSDVATLIYTAGTTGIPKGVELTHANITFAMRTLATRMQLPSGANQLSFLPMAHAMARMMDHYLGMMLGLSVSICSNPSRILDELKVVQPSLFVSTPRTWEKLRNDILAIVAAEPAATRKAAMSAAIDAGIARVRAEQAAFAANEPKPEHDFDSVHDALIGELTQAVGLGRVSAAIIGGAPVDLDLVQFFHAVGIPLGECFGMSESASVCTGNPPERVRFGTVGPALDGVTVRLAADGEVLLRGANVMRGYRGMPEKTAEVIDEAGWLHSGDIGAIDGDGYIRIVARKKDIIINAAGKNMSPILIETALTKASPLIGFAVAVGDRRPYNVALLVLEPDELRKFAAQAGHAHLTTAELAVHPAVVAELDAAVAQANTSLSRPEQIKRYTVLTEPWSPGGDELTATMKLRRLAINDKYAAQVDELYTALSPSA